MDAEQVTEVEQERNSRKEIIKKKHIDYKTCDTGEDKNEGNKWKDIDIHEYK